MARCPYGQHRILLSEGCTCKRCGGDLRLYAAARELPVAWYNEARRLWDSADWEEAGACLHAALKLRPDFLEALWLLGMVESRRGRAEQARDYLGRARDLGASVDPDWITVRPNAPTTASPGDTLARDNVSPAGEDAAGDRRRALIVTPGSGWRRASMAVAAGLIGFLLGVSSQPGRAPARVPPPLADGPSVAPSISEQAEGELAARGRQALQSRAGEYGEELRVAQVDLHTIRAEGQVASFKEKMLVDEALRSLPGVEAVDVGGIEVRERYVVRRGDSLWSIAAKRYHDPTQWQRIAAANAITTPHHLRPFTELIIMQ